MNRYRRREATYSIRPQRIILIRHGESEGNIDHTVYSKIPDNLIRLSKNGVNQARKAGEELKQVIGSETVKFYFSPYLRSQETLENILATAMFEKSQYSLREEPRLREQDWGNFQNPALIEKSMEERKLYGSFYYRFPLGESGADVYDSTIEFS